MKGSDLVVIPTYNEIGTVADMIHCVMSLPSRFDVLIVDDQSPDQTAERVMDLQELYPGRVFLKQRPQKKGIGLAYLDGFDYALSSGYDCIYEMDCDFSHNPAELEVMKGRLDSGDVDLVIGSRYCVGGGVSNWSEGRVILSKAASLYSRFWTQTCIADPTSGFVGYTARTLAYLVQKNDVGRYVNNVDWFQGYCFQIAMKFFASRAGFTLEEIPITFQERGSGRSKMSRWIVVEAVLILTLQRCDSASNSTHDFT